MVGGMAGPVVSADLIVAGVAIALYLLTRECLFRRWRKPRERRQ